MEVVLFVLVALGIGFQGGRMYERKNPRQPSEGSGGGSSVRPEKQK